MKQRAIVIDPFTKTVETKYKDFENAQEVYNTVGSYEVGTLQFTPTLLGLHDGNGAYRIEQQWFLFGAVALPIPGRVILLGVGKEGFKDAPFMQPATVERAITWIEPLLAMTYFPPSNHTQFESLAMPTVDMS